MLNCKILDAEKNFDSSFRGADRLQSFYSLFEIYLQDRLRTPI